MKPRQEVWCARENQAARPGLGSRIRWKKKHEEPKTSSRFERPRDRAPLAGKWASRLRSTKASCCDPKIDWGSGNSVPRARDVSHHRSRSLDRGLEREQRKTDLRRRHYCREKNEFLHAKRRPHKEIRCCLNSQAENCSR
jgi:hypothetical protein